MILAWIIFGIVTTYFIAKLMVDGEQILGKLTIGQFLLSIILGAVAGPLTLVFFIVLLIIGTIIEFFQKEFWRKKIF